MLGVDALLPQGARRESRALLIPRIPMNPPDWWRAAHPDEVMQWEDGLARQRCPVSPLYRHDAAERLAALVAHSRKSLASTWPAIIRSGQNTGEWFYEDTWKRP